MNLGYQTFNVITYAALFFILKNLAKNDNFKVIHKRLFKISSIIVLVLAIVLAIPTGMRWYVKIVDTYLAPPHEYQVAENPSQNVDSRISNIINMIKKDAKINSARDRIAQRSAYRDLLQIDNKDVINYCLKTIPDEPDIHRKILMVSLLETNKDPGRNAEIAELIIPIAEKSDNLYLSVAAIIVLGQIRTAQSFDALLDIIQNSSKEREVYTAIISIGDYKNPEAIPILKEKESSLLPTIKEAAQYSMNKILNPNYVPDEITDPKTYLDRKKNADRKAALQ